MLLNFFSSSSKTQRSEAKKILRIENFISLSYDNNLNTLSTKKEIDSVQLLYQNQQQQQQQPMPCKHPIDRENKNMN